MRKKRCAAACRERLRADQSFPEFRERDCLARKCRARFFDENDRTRILHEVTKPFKWLTESKPAPAPAPAAHKADPAPAAGKQAATAPAPTLHNSADKGSGWGGGLFGGLGKLSAGLGGGLGGVLGGGAGGYKGDGKGDGKGDNPQADHAKQNAQINQQAGASKDAAGPEKSGGLGTDAGAGGKKPTVTIQGGISEADVMKRVAEIKDPSKPYKPPSQFDEDKNGVKDGVEMQYSPKGIPITTEAWAMQSAIDGGKLFHLYQQMEATAKNQKPPQQLNDQAVIDAYLAAAKAKGKDAAFMAEVLPTETGTTDSLGALKTHIGGQDPALPAMQGTATTSMIRLGNIQLAEQLKGAPGNQAKDVYSLVVPYSNTPENILANNGVPQDGVDTLSKYLKAVGPDTTSLATGYSQGGGAVLNYVNQHGAKDGLDYAVAMAPMGGNDRHGGNGVNQGVLNGVNTLSIMHQLDPAQSLYDPTPGREKAGVNVDLIDRMIDFASSPNGWLHGDANVDDARKGTYGYQIKDVLPLVQNMFQNGPAGPGAADSYRRTGDWNMMPSAADKKTHDDAVKRDDERFKREDPVGYYTKLATNKAMSGIDKLFDNGVVDGAIDIGQKIHNGYNTVKEKAGDLWEGAKDKAGDVWNGAKGLWDKLF